jgi:hypothetical protein
MLELIAPIIAGIGNGVGIALFGYWKSIENGQLPAFDTEKFSITVITGGVIGGLAGASGMSYGDKATWAASTGLIFAIDTGGKAIIRWLRQRILKK